MRTDQGTVSSAVTEQGGLSRSDEVEIGEKEKMTASNGTVMGEEDLENTTVEESPEPEANTDDRSAETEEWNCTIQ